MAIELLAPTTSAADSAQFRVGNSTTSQAGGPPPVVFHCPVTGADTGSLQISHDNGSTWVNWQPDQTNRSGAFSSSVNHVRIWSPGVYRVRKNGTTGTVGVWVSTVEVP